MMEVSEEWGEDHPGLQLGIPSDRL